MSIHLEKLRYLATEIYKVKKWPLPRNNERGFRFSGK